MKEYLKSVVNENTKKIYTNFLKKTNEIYDLKVTDPQLIKEYIEGLDISKKSQQDKHHIVNKYYKFYNKPAYVFGKEVIPKLTPHKELPSRESLLALLNEIGNLEHKLLLHLLLKYDTVLRCDLSKIKFTDIKQNTIHFPKLNKTFKENVTLELDTSDIQIVNELRQLGNEFLFTLQTKDRANGYSKLIKCISKKYLNLEMTQTEFRRLSAQQSFDDCGLDEEFINKLKLFEITCKNRGHSVSVALSKYITIN